MIEFPRHSIQNALPPRGCVMQAPPISPAPVPFAERQRRQSTTPTRPPACSGNSSISSPAIGPAVLAANLRLGAMGPRSERLRKAAPKLRIMDAQGCSKEVQNVQHLRLSAIHPSAPGTIPS